MSDLELTYIPSLLVQNPLPLKDPKGNIFRREAGSQTLELLSGAGIPFGHHGRMTLALAVTDAIRNKTPKVDLGTVSGWLRRLEVSATGGDRGTIFSVRSQFHRIASLFLTWTARVEKSGAYGHRQVNMAVSDELQIWWTKNEHEANLPTLFENYLTFSGRFFEYISKHSVPADLEIYSKFQAPRAQDIYAWLAWKLNHLEKPLELTWAVLEPQFSDRPQKNQRSWRKDWLSDAAEVITTGYPGANVSGTESGILLKPSPKAIKPKEGGFLI